MDGILERIRHALEKRPPRVLVVGDLMIDRYFWGSCQRISPEAPVQIIDVGERSVAIGGAGNVAANLVALGARVTMASVVGGDENRAVLMQLLAQLGVEAGCIVTEHERPVTEKTRLVAAHQQVVRYDVETRRPIAPGSEERLVTRVIEALGHVDLVVVSDYGKGVLTPSLTHTLIARAHDRRIPVLCDPKGKDWSKYTGATAITPNKKEAADVAGIAITDDHSLERAGKHLLKTYAPERILITLSDEGMALIEANRCLRIPTVAKEVYDVTGAGDTMIASLAFALACGLDFDAACHFSNAAAGVSVSKMGTAAVTLEQVEQSALLIPRRGAFKIKSREDMAGLCDQLRRRGQKVVFVNGCFDILHVGHVKVLEEAAALGDVLVVGLNTDASVNRLKPGRPINGEQDRAQVVSALELVDHVVLFDEDTPLELIRALKPNVLVKGRDYQPDEIVGADVVLENGGAVHTVPLVEGRSTTDVVERVRELSS